MTIRFPRGMGTLLLASLFLLLAGCKQEPAITQCTTTINTAAPVLSNGFGFNLANTRNQVSSINSGNIGRLALDYTLAEPNVKERRGAPAVTEQTIYYHLPGAVEAVDRVSGCRYFSTAVSGRVRSASVTLYDDPVLKKRLFAVGTFDGFVHAFDAKTGAIVWSADVEEFGDQNMVTGGIQYHNGKLIVPVATKAVITAALTLACCESHGSVVALNSATGAKLWRFHGTDEADVLSSTRKAPNGVSVWSTPLIDTARNQILFGTSQNLTQPVTEYADSIVAIDLNTGAVKWHYKAIEDDAYNATCDLDTPVVNFCDGPDHDWDVITPLLTKNSAGADVIIAGDKSGNVFSLNPASGTLIWENRIGAGGKLGGIHWAMAVNSSHVFVGIADVTAAKSSVIDSLLGTDIFGFTSIAVPMIQVPNAMPGLYALDKDTGIVAWEFHDTHFADGVLVDSIYSAGLTVTNDLLFAASLDGVVKAFRAADGEQLWSFDTAINVTDKYGRAGNGGTVESVGPVIAGNNMLLNSGYNTFGGTNEFQSGPGNALFVFKLK